MGSFRRALLVLALVLAVPAPAGAIPVFAHRYGLECGACHTVVPHLNAFGAAFLANGYRLEGMREHGAIPLAVKLNLAYTSEPSPVLPKAIVDEVELLSGGRIGSRGSYFAEVYAIDGGFPGLVRDLWLAQRLTPLRAAIPVQLEAGQFTLPLPVDPETFRETSAHYAVFDQTVGANPFSFFEPKMGGSVTVGSSRGTSAALALLSGHDRQSGLPTDGVDRMLYLQHAAGPVLLSAYRYDGTRPIAPAGDRFWRQGYGLGFESKRLRFDALLQEGNDTNAGAGGARSSGGFVQARYELSPQTFFIARLDGTHDPSGFTRAFVAAVGRRVARNARVVVEDVVTHVPQTKHTLNAALLVAY